MRQALTMRRSVILCLALALSAYCYAQNLTIGNALPCGDDNMSCVPGELCYTRDEVCNGAAFCPVFGEDEGDPTILNALDCKRYHTCIIVVRLSAVFSITIVIAILYSF